MSIIERALKKAGKQGLVVGQQNKASLSDELKVGCRVGSEVERGQSVSDQPHLSTAEPINADEHLVSINWKGLADEGYIDNNNAKSQLAEEFRLIKRPLVNNAQETEGVGISRPNLILICSSVPSEGKTFVSINLALSIANERDKKVLLIDADVEKPSISDRLGIKRSPGLIDYLENDKINFSDILLKTDLANLNIIPAGNQHKYSTELLASQRMYLFAEEVSKRYKDRIVIFDSPPLLMTAQAQILAELVGQVVLVIAAETTPQAVVSESVSKLANCDVVMTLLNKTRKELDIYGYGYNYGYGKYGHS